MYILSFSTYTHIGGMVCPAVSGQAYGKRQGNCGADPPEREGQVESRKKILYVKTSLGVLAMLVLLVTVYRLEAVCAVEYDALPAVLADARAPTKPLAFWEDAATASVYHKEEGRYCLRIRPMFGAGKAGFNCREGVHTAFVVNRRNWYDGGDGWLYCDVPLGPGEASPPVCLQGYRDDAAVRADAYVRLIFEWRPCAGS